MAPRPSTAVPLVTTATRLARAVSSAAVRGIAHDLVAGGGDAGRIGERQVALGGQRLGRDDLDLPGPWEAMVAKRAFGEFIRQARLLVIP